MRFSARCRALTRRTGNRARPYLREPLDHAGVSQRGAVELLGIINPTQKRRSRKKRGYEPDSAIVAKTAFLTRPESDDLPQARGKVRRSCVVFDQLRTSNAGRFES